MFSNIIRFSLKERKGGGGVGKRKLVLHVVPSNHIYKSRLKLELWGES